ncbi:MAG: VCBS repeat-containing protein [Bacteroidetes bacterium]|nr:VCBS repeat-containing protein [Bacteroidota bacterium]
MKNIYPISSLIKKVKLVSLLTFFILFGFFSVVKVYALPPTLGNYPNTSVVSGGNTTIIPDAVPTDVLNAVAFTNTNFRGTLVVNPVTGELTVTNARQAGIYTITIKAFSTGGISVTASCTLTVLNPICSHPELTSTIDTLSGPVAIGDFNGDGFQDLAIANSPSASIYIVSIMTGDGLGGFTGTNNVLLGANPASVATGDFNGDGSLDIITCGGSSASVRLGNGSGGFSGTTEIPVGSGPIQLAIGDFNNDGLQDFATVNNSGDDVSIRLGDGTGNFSGNGEFAVGSWPFSIAVGDFNNDGNQDLATANFLSTDVSILLGDGIGGFVLFQSVSVGQDPGFVAIGDFNGDGNQDLGTTNDYSNTVSIRMGNGTGSFGGYTEVSVGCGPVSFAVVDFNGDGFQDLVTTNKFCNYFFTNTLSIRYGDGNGNFSGFEEINAGGVGPNSITAGDFNGDGKQDLVVTSSKISIFLGEDLI